MKIKKKYETGTARVFMSRKKAMKKLQLSLRDFRRLCILKGIYPREPLHKKKANKGSTVSGIYYHVKDVNFLASEPLIQKFREYKVFLRKLSRANAKREQERAKAILKTKPVFRLDSLVKERYPTFSAALRDMDDALCLAFGFAALTRTKIIRPHLIGECRRLTTEFMHYVIESQSLRKVFVSIKGIYYQAEIMGEKVTWIVGHERSVGQVSDVDFAVMANFVEFYITMLSFVNFRLFKSIGLFYPPQLQTTKALQPTDESSLLKSWQVGKLMV
jgi:pescadillo protein